MDKPILTRQDALAIGYIRYYTGKPCIHGHDSERYGIEYCVDHIIPIAHPDVCGLHTFANLQIITSEENRKKGQHFDPTEHKFIAEKS
jgi:5-methylcytosine-specific restriction endonuclease McrA